MYLYGTVKNSVSYFSTNPTILETIDVTTSPATAEPQSVKSLQRDFVVKLSPGEGFLACLSSMIYSRSSSWYRVRKCRLGR